LASEPFEKILYFDFVFYGRLLDINSHRGESLADLSYPVVLLQGRKSSSDRLIECLRDDLYGVLNISNILYRNCARSENHAWKGNIFAFYSPRQDLSSVLVCRRKGIPAVESAEAASFGVFRQFAM
jgi:hypothetical protein